MSDGGVQVPGGNDRTRANATQGPLHVLLCTHSQTGSLCGDNVPESKYNPGYGYFKESSHLTKLFNLIFGPKLVISIEIQECIPVGCVPSALVAVTGCVRGGGCSSLRQVKQ